MQPLQWVAVGYLLVLLDVPVGGWDVLPDPLGWVLVLAGLLAVTGWREVVGLPAVVASAVSLVVALVVAVPGLLDVSDPALAWGLSLPQVAASALLAFAVAEWSPRRRSWRLAGWLLAVVGVVPVVVLGTGTAAGQLVGLAAFVAVAASLYLVWLLLSAPASDEPSTQPG